MSEITPKGLPAQIAGKFERLPSLPQAAGRLMVEVLKSEPNIAEVVRIIESDPALVSRVLRLVNSPYHGARWRIATVEHAVGLLGLRAVESMVVSLTVFEAISGESGHALDFTRHWQHSLATAAAARFIAGKTGYEVPEEAYTAGILHDVGRAALDIAAPAEFARVMKALASDTGIGVAIEREHLGVDHAGVGEYVLRRWNIPEKTARSVGLHHADDSPPGADGAAVSLARIIQAADLAAWSAGLGGLDLAPKIAPSPAVREMYEGLDRQALFVEMEAELRRAAELFGVKVPNGGEIRSALSVTAAELGRIRAMRGEIEERLAKKSRAVAAIARLVGERPGGDGREVMKSLLGAVCEALSSERAVFFECDEKGGGLSGTLIQDITGVSAETTPIALPAPTAEDPLGGAMAAGRPVRIAAADGENALLERIASKEVICAPVKAGERTAGLIVTDNPISGKPFGETDLEVLGMLAAEAGLVLENSMLLEYSQELKAQAETDPLTDLNNRRHLLRLLEGEIQRSRRYRKPVSLVMIDIDRFKLFNDTYGHQAGDQVLAMLGKLLKNSCRNIDTPGRLGGEEFLVVLPETELEAAVIYAERVRALVEKLGARLGKRYPVHALTISVGLTSFNHENDDVDSFIRRADNAMYSAKQRGRNRICTL